MIEWIKKFLEKLAAANKQEFGNGRLDCCELGREKQAK
ncbi:MAG TPA: LDCC motif putative metal-binding protein [Clostridia bacterium]|nr:LDCC motif putative metal-binding protein [Clostridia bacterium]